MTGPSDLPYDVEAPTFAVADGSMPSTEKRIDTIRMLAAFLALVLVSFAALSGCATIEENPRTAIGSGVGAAGGAAAGGLISRGATGTVVGGADRRPRRRADATDRLAVSVEAHVTVSALPTERRSLLEQFARRLLEKEVVERDELQALLAGTKLS